MTAFEVVEARLKGMEETLRRIESRLGVLAQQRITKDCYSTKELAQILDKKEYTVREWCRLQRIHAKKIAGGRGNEGEWRIPHEEMLRIQNDGLLPIPRRY